jgi:hypothetical protein
MPPEGRPKASKTTTSWQPKQKKKPRKKQPRPKIERSKHPMVKLVKKIEKYGPVDVDVKEAAIAGFQSEHCAEGTVPGREIAKVKLANGNVKRVYVCDVCGHTASRETQA